MNRQDAKTAKGFVFIALLEKAAKQYTACLRQAKAARGAQPYSGALLVSHTCTTESIRQRSGFVA
jgi:hypothetical protein